MALPRVVESICNLLVCVPNALRRMTPGLFADHVRLWLGFCRNIRVRVRVGVRVRVIVRVGVRVRNGDMGRC